MTGEAACMDGAALIAWMDEHDWKTRELAEVLDKHPVTVAKWRAGTLPIDQASILALGNPQMTSARAREQRIAERKRARKRAAQLAAETKRKAAAAVA